MFTIWISWSPISFNTLQMHCSTHRKRKPLRTQTLLTLLVCESRWISTAFHVHSPVWLILKDWFQSLPQLSEDWRGLKTLRLALPFRGDTVLNWECKVSLNCKHTGWEWVGLMLFCYKLDWDSCFLLSAWVISSQINVFFSSDGSVCFNGRGGWDAECLMVIKLVGITQTAMWQSWRWCIWCPGHEPFMYFNSWGCTAECLMVI